MKNELVKIKILKDTSDDGKTFEVQLPSGTIIAQGGNCITFCGGTKRLIFPSGKTLIFPSFSNFLPVSMFDEWSVDKSVGFVRPGCTEDLTKTDYKLLIEFLYIKVKNEFDRTQKIPGKNLHAKYSRY